MTRDELNQRITDRMHQPTIKDGVLLVMRAREFAIKAHGKQQYGDQPYSTHLESVENVLIEFNHISSVLRAAAWQHDVIEDTNVLIEELKNNFPGIVTILVEAVTSEPGANRKERNQKTYQKIVKLKYAVVLKLADRIANVRHSIATGSDLLAMYNKEYPAFREALIGVQDITITPMWWMLDRLLDYQGV